MNSEIILFLFRRICRSAVYCLPPHLEKNTKPGGGGENQENQRDWGHRETKKDKSGWCKQNITAGLLVIYIFEECRVSTAEGNPKLTRKQCMLLSFLPWPGFLSLSFSVKEKHSTLATHVIMWVSITCCFLILFSPHLTTVWPYKSPVVTASLSLWQQS